MKTFPSLVAFLVFNQQSATVAFSGPKAILARNEKVQELLGAALKVGQAGSMATEEERSLMESLAKQAVKSTDPKPAKYRLEGVHNLVYSAAPGGSSGRLFGNVVGKVTQVFEDDEIFYNRVQLGPLLISLKARREIKNDVNIKVSFLETTISLFGLKLVQKEAGGGGVWKVKFVGEVKDANGKTKLVRIMETPSLFVIEQTL
jgi:hypothetical protein